MQLAGSAVACDRVLAFTGASTRLRPFDSAAGYEPASGAKHFLTGRPQILSLAALSEALTVWEGVDMAAVRRKSVALTSLFIDRVEHECGGFGLRLDHALAAVEPVGRDAMAQVRLSGLGVDRQRRLGNRIVRAVHAALGGSLATLLNWHRS
jgi:hypothetical protein